MVGKILGGRYEVLDRIGTGGMALVYRARDLTLNRVVAVKILKQQWAEDHDVIRRFDQEARAAASLTNLHVVQVFDVGREEPDLHYIVMELVHGQTLRQHLDSQAPLAVREALTIAEQVADALDAAHSKKLVHRDIKPQNILIADDKTVKVTDFGIAYATTSGTLVNTHSFLGTVQYLSPEQARGKLISAQSDLYSLGVVLFEMLTGRLPFDGDSAIGVALKHLQDQAPDVRSLRPTLPENVSRIVARALAKDLAERYQTASAMRAEMIRILDPDADVPPALPPLEPPAARPELPSRSKSKDGEKKHKSRAWWVVASAIAAVVIAGGIFAFYQWLDTPTVAVPNVHGATLAEAKHRLRSKGLLVSLAGSASSSTVGKGRVLHESPNPGSPVKGGQSVVLVLSSGPQPILLPSVLGETESQARRKLESLNIRKVTVDQQTSSQAKGVIVRQSPRATARVLPTATVTLWESKGPAVPRVLPNITGMTPSQAAKVLAKYNLGESSPAYIYSTQTVGTIIDQSPKPYQPINGVTEVSISVSDGPTHQSAKLPKEIRNPPFTMPSTIAAHSLFEEVVKDTSGNQEIFYQQVNPKQTVRNAFVWYGSHASVSIYVNQKFIPPNLTLTGQFIPNPGIGNGIGNSANSIGNQVGNGF